MTDLYYRRETCRLCGSPNVELAVPLRPIPIATPNFRVPDADRESPVFREAVPLELHLCADCGLLQVLHVGNPELQYGNYVYRTSLSLGLPEHFREYARGVIKTHRPPAGSLVLEFGSNDGTLLRAFKGEGMRVVGIDPARDIARKATEAGIETVNAFFAAEVAGRIRESHGAARLIIANNVIANIDELDPVAEGVRAVMAPDGAFLFETQYGLDVIEKMLLDTVYHEHLSYFYVKPLVSFFACHRMQVIDVEPISTKGGSIRVTVQHAGGPRLVAGRVAAAVAEEERRGMYDLARYRRFTAGIEALRAKLNGLADEQEAAGQLICGYGMSVGTTTLLAQFWLAGRIACLFDDDPDKERVLSGPGYDIPLYGPKAVLEKNPGAIVVFAWRYAESIMAKQGAYRARGGKFIVPLPEITVH